MIRTLGPMGQFGILLDVEPQMLPLNAWTDGINVHFRDGKVVRMAGYKSALTPSIAPWFAMYVQVEGGPFWLYAGATAVYATDNSSHGNITRTVGGAYGATADLNWTGGMLGGVPVINNGIDVPQVWSSPSLASPLVNLPNWPAGVTCRSLRPFKNFLVALDVTESGTRYPQMIRWSHPADPGTIPASWDYADPVYDAGRVVQSETGGYFLDQVTMRDVNILYKEDSCIGMQLIGGESVFRFFKIFDTVGMLTRRCAVEFFSGKHAVLTASDIVIHDGQSAKSLLQNKQRRSFFNRINAEMFERCFVAASFLTQEVYFCIPTGSSVFPDLALVWNWDEDTLSFRDLPLISHIANGAIDFTGASVGTWDSDSDTWDSDVTTWDFSPVRTNDVRMLWVQPNQDLLGAPFGLDADGVAMPAFVERVNVGIPVEANGPPDFTTRKLVRRFWPHITGEDGTTVNCYIGTSDAMDVDPTWQGPFSFTIGQTTWIDCMANGRLHSFRFSTSADTPWNLSAIDFDLVARGRNA